MKLTAEQKKDLFGILNQKWCNDKKCVICEQFTLDMNDTIFELREFHGDKIVGNSDRMPLLCVSCTNCGYTFFFINPLIDGNFHNG